MYKDLELQETVTKHDLVSYGFCFNERKRRFEFFRKLTDNIGVTFTVYIPENDNGRYINYKVTNLNTESPYAPFYSRKYSCNNKIADRVEEWLRDEVERMVKAGLVPMSITEIL